MGPRNLTDHAPVKVLHHPSLGNVAGHTKIQENVVKVGVLVRLQAAQHNKPRAIVYDLGDVDEPAAQLAKGKGAWVDIVWAKIG